MQLFNGDRRIVQWPGTKIAKIAREKKKLFISGGMGLVALYGISFGNRRTYQWLTAMMVNLFVNKHIVSSTKFHSFCHLINH